MCKINSYDIDGVIFMGSYTGLTPGSNDVIITGRSYEEEPETRKYMDSRGIQNVIFYAPWKFSEKTREKSGEHKAHTLSSIIAKGVDIGIHFEDDPVQADIIEELVDSVVVVRVVHDLTEKENVRHVF